jgi:hypothetical protein
VARVQQTQENKNDELAQMNAMPKHVGTLEEMMVDLMAPIIPPKRPVAFVQTPFKPIYESIGNASSI